MAASAIEWHLLFTAWTRSISRHLDSAVSSTHCSNSPWSENGVQEFAPDLAACPLQALRMVYPPFAVEGRIPDTVGQIEIPVCTQSLERRKLFRRKSCAF